MAWGVGAIGPREHFYAAASADQITASFPEWYQVPLLTIAAPLDPGARDPDAPTPGAQALNGAYRDLLPAVLGGSP